MYCWAVGAALPVGFLFCTFFSNKFIKHFIICFYLTFFIYFLVKFLMCYKLGIVSWNIGYVDRFNLKLIDIVIVLNFVVLSIRS